MRIINENSDGNIGMLMIGGDEQYDGNTVTVSSCQSIRQFEAFILPKLSPPLLVSKGGEKCKPSIIKKDIYYPDMLHIGGNCYLRFYRHHSLSVHEAFIKLFNGYKGG